MKRKHVLVSLVLISLFVLAFAANQAYPQTSQEAVSGNERIVELYIQGCDWPETALRISLILEAIDGVMAVETDPGNHTATVTFDPSKTTVEEMIEAIEESSGVYEGRFEVLSVKFLK